MQCRSRLGTEAVEREREQFGFTPQAWSDQEERLTCFRVL